MDKVYGEDETLREVAQRFKWAKFRWLCVTDGGAKSFSSRAKARAEQSGSNGHPGSADIRAFGPYGNVDGEARVYDLGTPDASRAKEGKASYKVFREDERNEKR